MKKIIVIGVILLFLGSSIPVLAHSSEKCLFNSGVGKGENTTLKYSGVLNKITVLNITNIGNCSAINIAWDGVVHGGYFHRINFISEGRLTELPSGQTLTVTIPFPRFGFGSFYYRMNVTVENANGLNEYNMFIIIGFLIMIMH